MYIIPSELRCCCKTGEGPRCENQGQPESGFDFYICQEHEAEFEGWLEYFSQHPEEVRR